jgi:hypothetical protein
MKLPDYLVVGECKCGTSSIYHYLTKHPQILETYGNGIDDYLGTKELRFFDRYYDKGLDWYKSKFPDTANGQITGEGASIYFGRMISLDRIKRDLPHVKIIVLLRNPIDRLYSHFCHMRKWIPDWKNKYDSFENFLNSAREEDNYLIEKGIYVRPLSKWFDVFGSQVMVIESETLFKAPQKICDDIFSWLGVDAFELKNFEKLNSSSLSTIKPQTRKTLKAFYASYNKELYELIGYKMQWED